MYGGKNRLTIFTTFTNDIVIMTITYINKPKDYGNVN